MRNGYKTAKPARFPAGKTTYEKSRAQAKRNRLTGETKIQALTQINGALPSTMTVGGGPVAFTNFCLGTAPGAWTGANGQPNFTDLNGFIWPNGTLSNQRIGRYMYLKRTTLQMRVSMNQLSRHGPVRFRLIVYKEMRNRYNTPGNGNPNTDLFIDHEGNDTGFNIVTANANQVQDMNTQLVNRRNYKVVKDFKFTLAPEQNQVQGQAIPFNVNQHNKSSKDITLKLGHYHKATFGQDNTPDDFKYRYCITLVSYPTSNSLDNHTGYSTSIRGTVSASDN